MTQFLPFDIRRRNALWEAGCLPEGHKFRQPDAYIKVNSERALDELLTEIQLVQDAHKRQKFPVASWEKAASDVSSLRSRYRAAVLENIELKRRISHCKNKWAIELIGFDQENLRTFPPAEHYAEIAITSDELAKSQVLGWTQILHEIESVNEDLSDVLYYGTTEDPWQLLPRLFAYIKTLETRINGQQSHLEEIVRKQAVGSKRGKAAGKGR